MPIRITGLTSGLDTEAIISALVSSYNYKTNKYKKAQTKLSWKQDAWKSLNTKIYSFYSSVGNLKLSSAYNLKSTTVSDSTKATITASSSAPTGTQKLNILSVAQAGYLTGGQLSSSTTTSTTMAELGYTGGDAKINLTKGDGTTKEITVTQGTTVGSFIASLKDAGVSANYDETNHRIFISSKETGKDSDFTLTGANSDGARALYQLGLNVDSTATSNTYATYTKYAGKDGKSTKELVEAAIADYQSAKTSYDKMSAQNANMTSAYGYASAYAAMKDALANSGLTEDSGDQEKLRTLLGMSATQRVNSVMDADGSVYTKKTTNDDGSVVYENNGKYILGVTTATDGSTTYTKDAQGNYVADGKVYKANGKKDADGNAYYVYKDENGTETTVAMKDEKTTYYEATTSEQGTGKYKYEDSNGVVYTPNDTGTYAGSDGNTYSFDASTSTFTQVDSKGNVVSGGKTATVSDTQKSEITKTVYTKGAAVSDAKRSADVLTSLKEDANYKLTDAETTTLASNIQKVNVYESADDKLGDDTDEYSRKSIISKIQDAYIAGGAAKVSEVTSAYATKINENQTNMEKAQTTMNDNSVLADLAAMDTSTPEGQAAYNTALKEFSQKVDDINALASDPTIKTNSDAKKIDGSDSEIQLNGITYTSSLNTYSINGLSITALQATGAGDTNAITVTTATDTQGVYDKVKSFLTQYNALINEITSLYNADTAKGYEPLTDDEKSAMSDSEVEKWEEKIKSSLLRRDDSLESVMNAMTNAMSQPITVNGKSYYLSSFGIKTLGYLNAPTNQQYAYHIDGDEEDTASSGNADKLMAMINSDPDTVVSFMQQLATNVYDAIGKKMQTSSLSSIYKVYNDKEMASEYSDYTTTIKKWEQKLQDQEDAYYKKFSAMETALSKLQSQTSSMSSLFGS